MLGVGSGMNYKHVDEILLDWWKYYTTGLQWWLLSSVNLLKTIQLSILNGLIYDI